MMQSQFLGAQLAHKVIQDHANLWAGLNFWNADGCGTPQTMRVRWEVPKAKSSTLLRQCPSPELDRPDHIDFSMSWPKVPREFRPTTPADADPRFQSNQ